jgi:serine protease
MAGVVALMLAVNSELTPEDIDMLLAGTHPDTSTRITRDVGLPGRDDFYGYGLIDAAQAVIAAGEAGAAEPSMLNLSTTSLDFGTSLTELPVTASNAGDGTLNITSVTTDAPWLTAAPTSGDATAVIDLAMTVAEPSRLSLSTTSLGFRHFIDELTFTASNSGAGTLNITSVTTDAAWLAAAPTSGEAPLVITVTVDRSGLADGSYAGTVEVESDATAGAATVVVDVTMNVGGLTGDVGETVVWVLDPATMETLAEVAPDASQGYLYTTPVLAPGTYVVVAGTDRDGDDVICDTEDACGAASTQVTVSAVEATTGVDIVVTEVAGPEAYGP